MSHSMTLIYTLINSIAEIHDRHGGVAQKRYNRTQ